MELIPVLLFTIALCIFLYTKKDQNTYYYDDKEDIQ